MNAADPLAQLRDIHLPDPVSWWPPAPGWWVVTLLALAAISLGIFFIRKLWLRNRYRRAALRELHDLGTNPQNDQKELLKKLSTLLRRVAVQAYGRNEVAPLSGDRWLEFLDRTGQTNQFSQGAAKVLGSGLYQSTIEADMEQVRKLIQRWIKEHKR